MDAATVVIGQDLQLDVARPIEILLEIDAIVAEPASASRRARLQPLEQGGLVAATTHAGRRRRPPL